MAAEELRRRPREKLGASGQSARAASLQAGLSSGTLHGLLTKPEQPVEADTARKLAAYFGWPAVEVFRWADILPPAEPGDPLATLREALYAGAWAEDVSRALYTLAAATRTPAVADLPLELVERVRAAWDYARRTQAAYQERDPAWRERRVAERFTQYLTGEVERAPQLESSADIVDLRP
jgi:hypothetical protein